jgi:hypothetical protein
MKHHYRILSITAWVGLAISFFIAPTLVWADEEGFQPIFDGKTLNGWDGNPKRWSVEEGAITGITDENDPLKYNEFCIWRAGELDDFILRFK